MATAKTAMLTAIVHCAETARITAYVYGRSYLSQGWQFMGEPLMLQAYVYAGCYVSLNIKPP